MIEAKKWDPKQPLVLPGLYADIPIEIYHGPKFSAEPTLSSSGARRIFTDSPMEYWIEAAHNPNRLESDEKEAFLLGRALHHVALGEADFGKKFVIRPEKLNLKDWHASRKDCIEWVTEKRLDGLTILTPSQGNQILGMAGLLPWQKGLDDSGLLNSNIVRDLGILSGLVEHTLVWRDKETGVILRGRPDAIPLVDGVSGDLKSTTAVSQDSLERTLSDLRYDMQAALIRWGMREVCGIDLTNFAFVFVMKKPPYAVQVVEIRSQTMDDAEDDLRAAVRLFAQCLKKNIWPGPNGRSGDVISIGLTPWARKQADLRRMMIDQEIREMAA